MKMNNTGLNSKPRVGFGMSYWEKKALQALAVNLKTDKEAKAIRAVFKQVKGNPDVLEIPDGINVYLSVNPEYSREEKPFGRGYRDFITAKATRADSSGNNAGGHRVSVYRENYENEETPENYLPRMAKRAIEAIEAKEEEARKALEAKEAKKIAEEAKQRAEEAEKQRVEEFRKKRMDLFV